MKTLTAVFALLLLVVTVPAMAQIKLSPYAENGLAILGFAKEDIAKVDTFFYGEWILSASGKEYLPRTEVARYERDIDATNADQALLFQGKYDSKKFPNSRMNSSENYNLAQDRPSPLLQYAIETGKGRLSLPLQPIEGKRGVMMWRVTLKPASKPPNYVTEERLEERIGATEIDLASVTVRVKRLEETQYVPPTPEPVPFDRIHLFVGYEYHDVGPENAQGLSVSFSLPMFTLIQVGGIFGGGYQGQGGITGFIEATQPLFGTDGGFCLTEGAAVSFYRNLDKSLPAPYRTLKYGGPYVGVKSFIPLPASRRIEIALLYNPCAEIIVSNAGIQCKDWIPHYGIRFSFMPF
jgi:hypothetical protein